MIGKEFDQIFSRTAVGGELSRPGLGPGPLSSPIRSWSGAVIVSLAALCALALVPATASAAPQGPWQVPATDLSASAADAIAPDLKILPDGSAIAVWWINDGPSNSIQASTRPPGGSFGAPFDLSEPTENAVGPTLAIGSDGSAAVTWLRVDTPDRIVRAVTSAPGGSFGEPVDISEAGQDAFEQEVAVGPDGSATAVWRRAGIIQTSTRPSGGSFGTPVDISATGAESPQIAIGPDGAATVVWRRAGIIQASTRPPGGSFGIPLDLSESSENANGPTIAVGSDKTTIVAWRTGSGCDVSTPCIIQSSTRPPDGSFGTPEDLSDAGGTSRGQQIVIGPDGAATAVWQLFDGTWWIIQTADRPAGGPFGAPVDLTGIDNFSTAPSIAIGPDGTKTVVWQFNAVDFSTPGVIQSATRPPGGSFGPVADLSASGQGNAVDAKIAIGPDGTATSVWTSDDGTNEDILTASTTSPIYALGVNGSGSGQGTVTSSPGGIDCGDECVEVFTSLTEVTLTATAEPGSTFTGWTGPCSGTDTCVLTMDQTRSVSATFELQARPVAVAKISKVKVSGPKKVKKGKKGTYKVRISNSGNAAANGVKLKVKGKGVKAKRSVGKIAAGKSKTVKVKVKPKKPGKVKASFKVTSKNAGGKTVKKTIKVKK